MSISTQFSPPQFGQLNAFSRPRFGNDDDTLGTETNTTESDADVVDLSTETDEVAASGASTKTADTDGIEADSNNPVEDVLDGLREKAHPFAQKAAQFLVGLQKVAANIINVIGNIVETLANTISGGDEEKAQALLMKWHGVDPEEAKANAQEMIQQQILGLSNFLGVDPAPLMEQFEKVKDTIGASAESSDAASDNGAKPTGSEKPPFTGQYL